MEAYLRYPHVHSDQVTFVAADDVWLAPVSGGRAWRLSDDGLPARNPRFSPGGTHVAWTSKRGGSFEVSVARLDSGVVRQLTWLGCATEVLGWLDEDRILIATAAGQHDTRRTTARAVALDGTMTDLGIGPVSALALHPGGPWALATTTSRPPQDWKRYRGGTAAQLWWRPDPDRPWARLLPDETASLVSPLWVGDTLVFCSDREGVPSEFTGQANLWALTGIASSESVGAPRRLTEHTVEDGYVRDASTDGQRIVYGSRGRLFLLERLEHGEPQPLAIHLPGTPRARMPRLLDPHQNLHTVCVDHTGDTSLIGWWGNAVNLPHRDGPARVLAADSAVRRREPVLLGRSGFAAMAADRDGECVEIHSLTGAEPVRTLAAGAVGRILHLTSSPTGDRLAGVSHDGRLWLLTLATGVVQDLARSENGEAESPVFSPDGRYLVWSEPSAPYGPHRLVAVDLSRLDGADGATLIPLTDGRFHDFSPAFSPDGQYVMFLSARTFDPAYDEHGFDLAFHATVRPHLVPLAANVPSPFGPSLTGWPVETPADADAAAPTDDAPGPTLDPEGFEERLVVFPVPAGHYATLRAAKGGALWLRKQPGGVLGSGYAGAGEPPTDVVEFFSFASRSPVTIAPAATGFAVSGNGTRIVFWHKESLTACPATATSEDADRISIDLDRLRVTQDPVAQWRQMFDETCRLMSQQFWRPDLGGADWDAIQQRYRPVVELLTSHDDLIDLLWETVAELNTSHAYASAPSEPAAEDEIGLLGVDLEPAEDGWRITRILPGETSDPDARSPLRAAGVDARVGDLITAVNGSAVPKDVGPGPLLIGTIDKPVELTLTRAGALRRVVVVPTGKEAALRYQAWVADRRDHTHRASSGQLGYVHIPDMMGSGWAQLNRDLRRETRADALIVDVRYNRGGHISELVIEQLARRVVAWDLGRHIAEAASYPDLTPRGPVVMLTNRWAGSDGDIVNAAAQALRIGPVVGERTWGGVVGIDGRFTLVDGTEVTQPRYAFWFTDKGWTVENHGVDPDLEVVMTPDDEAAGADPQLDRAIAEALRLLSVHPAARPPHTPGTHK